MAEPASPEIGTTTLSPDEFAAATRPIASARGLPNRAYTSLDWARAERDGLLGRTWTCLGFADEVAPRHAVPVDLLGLPLVIVRDRDGVLRVFHNVCRHRGHKLIEEPRRLTAGFVCPYHCWTYGFDGALRNTPHIGGTDVHEAEDFDKRAHGLLEVRSAVWMGMLFVNLSGEAPDFATFITPLRQRWEAFTGAGGLEALNIAPAAPEAQLEVGGNWKLALENYVESYHLPFLHPTLNTYSPMARHYNIMAGDWRRGEDWGAGQGTTTFEYAERAGISFPCFADWPADRLNHAEYIALYPNVLLGIQCDHAFVMVLSPSAPDRTLETVRLYFVGDDALGEDYAAARAELLRDWMAIFDEDVGVVEGMQHGRASTAFDGGAFSAFHDEGTHHFHRWVAMRMAPPDARAAEETDSRVA